MNVIEKMIVWWQKSKQARVEMLLNGSITDMATYKAIVHEIKLHDEFIRDLKKIAVGDEESMLDDDD